MDQKRKEYIDSLWMDTPFGKWVIAAESGNKEEAGKIAEEVLESYPFTLENLEALLCKEIASKLSRPIEFRDYLMLLDEENPSLVEFMIQMDIFGKLY